MGTTNTKSITHVAEIAALKKTLSAISRDFPDFQPRGPFPLSLINVKFGKISPLLAFEKVKCDSVSISGASKPNPELLASLIDSWMSSLVELPRGMQARIRIGFEERQSKQSRSSCDTAGLSFTNGNVSFSYYADGSKVARDLEYRRAFYSRLIDIMMLPLSTRDVQGGFIFEHRNPEGLEILRGGEDGKNPSAFHCQISKEEISGYGGKLMRALGEIGSGKIFQFQWMMGTGRGGNPSHLPASGNEVFRFISSMKPSAENYELQAQATFSTLDELDLIRSSVSRKDSILVQVGAFAFDAERFVNVEVRANEEGYQINLESRHPIPASLATKYGADS
jgi:hypothetical protein